MKRFIIPAVAALSAVTTSTFAATVYVDGASGDDSAAGTSEAPLKTIAAGVAAAAGTASPKTVIVRSGTYKITELIAISNGVSVVSETGDPDDVIVDGQGVTPVFQWTDWSSNGSRLEGITVCNGFYGSPNSGQPITAGVYMRGGMLTNCVVRDCLLTSGSGSAAAYGAGVKTDANRTHKIIPRIVDCHIYGNTVSNDCTTTYNTVHGGGIALIDSGGVISGCVVENNMVWFRKWNDRDIGLDAATGAGISVNTRGEISDCIIRNNIATNANNNGWAGGGGGIAAGSESVVSNCLVYGNTVSCYGGGISTSSGTLITHCTVTNNSVLGPPNLVAMISGGGVSLSGEGSRCLNSLIHDNRVVCGGGSINTKSGGGAVGISGTDCLLANCSVVGNSANCGGAFFIGNFLGGSGMNAVVSNCYVYGNAATVNSGVLGYYIPQNVLMTDCIVVSNSAAHAGICFGYKAGRDCGGLKFRNSWFYGNYIDGSNVNGDGMFCGQLTQTHVQPLSLEYCTIVSNFPRYRVVYPGATEVSNYFCRGCVFFGNRNYKEGGAASSVSQTLAGLTNAWYNFSDSNGFDFDDPVYGNFKTAAKEDFVDFDAGRCRIAESSHMRDKGGVAEDWMLGKNSLDMGTGEMTVTPVGDYGIELTRVGAVRRLKNLPEPGCFELWYPAGTVLSIR